MSAVPGFVAALRGERLKLRRSLAPALVAGGALLTPAIVLAIRLLHPANLPALYSKPGFWTGLWKDCWESMAIFFLPMGAILLVSLVTQLEWRGNAWKQVLTLPLPAGTVWLAKLTLILALLAQVLALFAAGVVLAGLVPALLVPGVPSPGAPPVLDFLPDLARYFVDALPIVAVQYLLCLRTGSALAPVACGFGAWVLALAALSSQHAWLMPYSHSMLEYLQHAATRAPPAPPVDFHWSALAWCLAAGAAGWRLFVMRGVRA